MEKNQVIRQFILDNTPTRRQLLKFILVKLQGRVTEDEFNRNYRDFRGQYSTAISKWQHFGNLEIINHRYYITEQGKRVKGLYEYPVEAKLINAEKRIKQLRERLHEAYKKVNRLDRENQNLRTELSVEQALELF